jgi:hypothetical protein
MPLDQEGEQVGKFEFFSGVPKSLIREATSSATRRSVP